MSEVKISNDNGSTTTFNFKFDNGLPVKPIINPAYETGYSEEDQFYVLSMYLTDEDLKKLENLNIEGFTYSLDKKEIWLLINEHYVVFGEVSDIIIRAFDKRNVAFYYLKENGEFIKGRKIG